MKAKVKHYLIIAVGWIFLILGIIGLFLPFLQGILFILIGLYILSHEYHWARDIFDRLKIRYPKITRKFYEIKGKAGSRFGRLLKSRKRKSHS